MISSLINKAKDLGFVSVGFSRPEMPLFFKQFCEWIAAGNQGDMHWMEKHLGIREDPPKLLDGCKMQKLYNSNNPQTRNSVTKP